MASCFRNICAKNRQNPLILFKVTIDNVGVPFFETQCTISGKLFHIVLTLLEKLNLRRSIVSHMVLPYLVDVSGVTTVQIVGGDEPARPEWPKLEARRAESGGGVLEEGAAGPLPTSCLLYTSPSPRD